MAFTRGVLQIGDMNKQLLIFPAIAFGFVAVFALRGLSIDGTAAPSVLVGKPAPALNLEAIPRYGEPFNPAELKGEVVLVNIWGSWCVNCLYEHPVLLAMQASGVKIYGLAWNDTPEAAAIWLDRYQSPFEAVGLDQTGFSVAEFGVTGAPETFVIDASGTIRTRFIGALTMQQWEREIKPMIEELRREAVMFPPASS